MQRLEVGPGHAGADRPVRIDLVRLGRAIVIASAVVWGLGLLREIIVGAVGTETIVEDLRQLWLDVEHSLPAWYSSVLMLAIAAMLALIAGLRRREGNRDAPRWSLLALVFLAMAVDEAVSFHEVLIDPVRTLAGAGGLFHFAWVIPGALGVLALGLYFLPFLLRLPRRTGWLFAAAGLVYVGGALGMEMVGGAMAEAFGIASPPYIAAFVVEEGLELAGLTAFLLALFGCIGARDAGVVTIVLAGREGAQSATA